MYGKEDKQVTAVAAKTSKEERGPLGLAEGTRVSTSKHLNSSNFQSVFRTLDLFQNT